MAGKRVFGLDVFRSVAILLVVFSHGMQLVPYFSALAGFLNIFSYLGVELFFVLSGFLIGKILIETLTPVSSFENVIEFWKRRWWRTLPNYYLFLVINLIGFGLFKDGFQFDPSYIFFAQNLVSPNSGFFSVSWSLAVEEWFYLITPLVFFFCLKVTKNTVSAFFISCVTLLFFSMFSRWIYIQVGDVSWNDEMRRVVILRLDSLMYGVIAAWFWMHNRVHLINWRFVLVALGLLLLAISVWMRNHSSVNNSPLMLFILFPLASIGSALLLPALSYWRSSAEGNFIGASFKNTSIWSYSLYLIHIPLLEIYRLSVFSQVKHSVLLQLLGFVVWLLMAYLMSYLIFRFFEHPITGLRDKTPFINLFQKNLPEKVD
jgi:peptidoglycan/LPS O-acetylase OafA/YrhL